MLPKVHGSIDSVFSVTFANRFEPLSPDNLECSVLDLLLLMKEGIPPDDSVKS